MTNIMDIPSIEKLASSSDKYLFLTALFVLATFGWLVLKKLLEFSAQGKAETEKCRQTSDSIRERWEVSSNQLAVCVDRNTEAFRASSKMMEENRDSNKELVHVLQGIKTTIIGK